MAECVRFIDLGPNPDIMQRSPEPIEDCSTYILLQPSEYNELFMLAGMTIEDANQLIGSTALIFSVAFIFRVILNFISNR